MALAGNVGTLNIEVRAMTNKVKTDIEKAFYSAMDVAQYAGQQMQKKLADGMSSNGGRYKAIDSAVESLKKLYPEAEKARAGFYKLSATGYMLQGGLGAIAGSVSSLVGGLGAMVGVVGAAAPAVVALAGAFAALKVGMAVGKLAFSGIAQALSGLNRAGRSGKKDQIELAKENLAQVLQRNKEALVRADREVKDSQKSLTKTLKDAREEYQQLGFSAEQAALDEEGAGIALERAREELARTQDLAPNDRVRREAELAYKNAELHLREAKDKTADLNTEQQRLAKNGIEDMDSVIQARRNASDAIDNQTKAIREAMLAQRKAEKEVERSRKGAAGSDPLKGLSKSQKEFVLYLQSLRPLMMDLKEAAAGGFLPALREQMDALINGGMFTKLTAGIAEVSLGLGQATKNFTNTLLEPKVMDDFSSFMSESAKLLPVFGSMLGNVFGGVLGILKAAQPLTDKFMAFLNAKTTGFKNMIDTKSATGELETFFNRAGVVAAQFGHIFGNLFAGLGSMVKANFGPTSGGQLLLNWLDNSTAKFRNLNDAASQNKMQSYFLSAAGNTHAMMSTLGAVLATFKQLGTDPSVTTFWNTLRGGVPALKEILSSAQQTAPAMAKMLVSVTKLVASLADAGGAKAFFNTMSTIFDIFTNLLTALKPVLDYMGRLHGVFVALFIVTGLLSKVKLIYMGALIKVGTATKTLMGQTAGYTALQKASTTATENVTAATIRQKEADIALSRALTKYEIVNATARASDEERAIALLELEVAEMNAAVATDKHTAAVAAEAAAQKRANGIGAKLGRVAAVGGAWAMGIGIAVEAVNMLQQSFIDAKVAALNTGDAIMNAMVTGASGVDTLNVSLDKLEAYATSNMFDSGMAPLITQVDALKAGIDDIASNDGWAQFWGVGKSTNLLDSVNFEALKKQLSVVGTQMGTIAGSNLPAMQKQFREMTKVTGTSKWEVINFAKSLGPDFDKALTDAATNLGVAATESNKMHIALGDSTAQAWMAAKAARDLAAGIYESSQKMMDYSEAVNSTTKDGKANLKAFLKEQQKNIAATVKYNNNILYLAAHGASAATLDGLKGMDPKIAAQYAQQMIDGGVNAIKSANAVFESSAKAASGGVAKGFTDNLTVVQTAAAQLGNAAAEEIRKKLANGELTAQQAIDAYHLKMDPVEVTVVVDKTETEKSIKKAIQSPWWAGLWNFGRLILPGAKLLPSIQTESTGGLIRGFASGGGYRVSGSGGSKADRVPAMLSPGEYVINARATREAYQTIQAINSGRLTDRSIVGGSKGKVHTVHEKAAPNILITVNPSAGMNEQDLAAIVSRQIGFQFSKGTM